MKLNFKLEVKIMRTETYNTKQKQLIFDFLKQNADKQFSCEQICDFLKAEGTPVSKPTVYRYLAKLCDKGTLRKFSDEKSASFQYIDSDLSCHEHMHLKCLNCGEFVHLGCDFMTQVGRHISEHHNFKVDNSKTVILGLCQNCAASKD